MPHMQILMDPHLDDEDVVDLIFKKHGGSNSEKL
jgi:hypothetical protein